MNQSIEILIVEDSPTEAEQVKHLLEERGFAITLATDGQEAQASAHGLPPALRRVVQARASGQAPNAQCSPADEDE